MFCLFLYVLAFDIYLVIAAGKYSNESVPSCESCDGGRFSSSFGSSVCDSCVIGTYSVPGAVCI